MMILALVLPAMSLMVLGSLWLWQNGLVLLWAMGACVLSVVIYGFELWMLRPRRRAGSVTQQSDAAQSTATSPTTASADAANHGGVAAAAASENHGEAGSPKADAPDTQRGEDGDASWSAAEHQVWHSVLALSEAVKPEQLKDRKAVFDLGRDTVLLVAQGLHGDKHDAHLQFTVPEALALVEQVSRRLRPFIIQSVPLGEQITVAQAMALYEWRGAVKLASRGYDLWRMVRVLNPLSAATQEMRERVTKKFYQWGREAVAQKLARRYVQEVGRAALDLYAGRLKLSPDELAGHVSARSADDLEQATDQFSEPLRVLLVGQTSAGKSSLVNALSGDVAALVDVLPRTRTMTPHVLRKDGLSGALLLDSPGLNQTFPPAQQPPAHDVTEGAATRGALQPTPAHGAPWWTSDQFCNEALDCDLILWVMSALKADRETDRLAMAQLRRCFAAHPDRHCPQIIVVMSHIDGLRPFNDWRPPYDLAEQDNAKSVAIVAARAAISTDLELDDCDIVPVYMGGDFATYNIDKVWAMITARLPQAKAARLSRIFGEAETGFSWKRLGAQTLAGARSIKDSIGKK